MLNSQTVDQIKKQIKNAGLNIDQSIEIAKDQGYSEEQIKSAVNSQKSELEIKNEQDIANSNSRIDELIIDDNEVAQESIIEPLIENIESENLDYFGYNIFNADPAAFQSSMFGAVDPNYNIGPGDQIIIMLWGESQFRQQFTVDREGYVFLPEVGQVFVNGLNLEALEKKFFQILSKVYSTLNPQQGSSTTFMDISIGELRPLRIIVLGEVRQPGAYLVSPSSSLSSSLYYFNGPTIYGSLREIRLIRKGEFIGAIDFYDYLLSGNIPKDFRLQMDDVIFIPPRGKTVAIKGEINRQGLYELKQNEGLSDLLEISGDLKVSAYMNRAQVSRIVPREERSQIGMDRILVDINLEDFLNNDIDFNLFDGDTVEIFSINDIYSNYVIISSSSVSRPGKYELTPGMKISDLIHSADGLMNNAYLEEAHLRRIKDDLTFELISVNLKKLFDGDLDQDINLKFMDELLIYNTNELKNNFNNIYINGPLKNTGYFSMESGKTLGDLILLTGGFNDQVNKVKIVVSRQNKNKFYPKIYNFPNSKKSFLSINDLSDPNNNINKFLLSPDDIISVYSDPKDYINQSVFINGAVYFPGSYQILSNEDRVGDLISRAGGLLNNAYPMASSFIRDNKEIRLSFDDIIKNRKSKDNFILLPGDLINIKFKTNIVEIIGEINQPGHYKFYQNHNLNDYIQIAGGLTDYANKNQIWITYPDGNSKILKWYLPSPRIKDSSVITVGRKQDTDPIDKTEFAKELASIFSDFLQIALTIAVISNNATN